MPGRWFLFLLSFVCLLGIGLHFYFQHQIQRLSREKQTLFLTRERLARQITRLKKDPSAYEEIARQKYGLIKDGERLIIFGN